MENRWRPVVKPDAIAFVRIVCDVDKGVMVFADYWGVWMVVWGNVLSLWKII